MKTTRRTTLTTLTTILVISILLLNTHFTCYSMYSSDNHSEPETQSEVGAKIATKIGAETKAKVETKTETRAEVKVEPEIEAEYEEECTFCDGDELTMKEKCEELIWKALTDEKNLLDDGIISEEIYTLQCEPFETALKELETATDEETLEWYKWILIYHIESVSEESSEEIDQEFYDYIIEESEKVGLAEELALY